MERVIVIHVTLYVLYLYGKTKSILSSFSISYHLFTTTNTTTSSASSFPSDSNSFFLFLFLLLIVTLFHLPAFAKSLCAWIVFSLGDSVCFPFPSLPYLKFACIWSWQGWYNSLCEKNNDKARNIIGFRSSSFFPSISSSSLFLFLLHSM